MAQIGFDRYSPLYQEDLNIIANNIPLVSLAGKTIAVTGASGLLGTKIIDSLMFINQNYNANINIIALGRNTNNLIDRFSIYLDYSDFRIEGYEASQRFPDIEADYVIHCAGNSHPKLFSVDPVGTLLGNIKGADGVLTYASHHNSVALIISSGEIYGENLSDNRMNEDYTGALNLNNARSCYTEGKRAVESLCQSYATQYNTKVKIARPCRIFGPTMSSNDNKASAQFFKNGKSGRDIILKSDGSQLFSYIYAADAVSALITILIDGQISVPYNVSNTECNIKLRDFASLIAKHANVGIEMDLVGEEGGSKVCNALLDNTRLLNLGWKPQFDINSAVRRTLDIMKL